MSLQPALYLSLFVHGALLALGGLAQHSVSQGEEGPVMQAMLATARAPVAAPAQEIRRPQPERTASVPPLPQPEAASARASAPPAPAIGAAEMVSAEAGVDKAREHASAAEVVSAAPGGQAVAAEVRDGVSTEALHQYRQALAREARRHRQYPLLARNRGWEGTAEVRVQVTVGQSPVVALARSSGHRLLDERALEMMAQAILVAVLPESLRGQTFSVPVPVQFVLGE